MKNRKIVLLLVFLFSMSLLSGCNTGEGKESQEVEDLEEVSDELEEREFEDVEIIEVDEYGIASDNESVSFVDGRGQETKISKKPEKVVILFASFLDIWIRNGGEIVGMVEPSEEYMLPDLEGVKTVGKRGSISLEEVMVLDPDLVILSSNTSAHIDMIAPLEGAGVEVMALDYSFKDDYFKISKLFAVINDELNLYKAEAEKTKDGIQEIIDKIPEENNPTGIIIMSTKSNISVRTANTTIGEMFKDLKLVNIGDLSNDGEGNKDFSLEKILEDDPDFIFVQTMGSDLEAVKEKLKSDVESNPAWSSLSAVKNGNYIILPKDLYTYKANHRYKEAYENLAKILYADIFN